MYPLVSIMIPVYNAERYLERCLESVLSQTYSNIEIVLVNDGSTDFSGNICDRYAELDNRIKVFHKHNEGVAATRNYLLSKVNGDYLMFVDSDDTIPNDAVSVMYERMVRDGSDMAVGRYITVEESGEQTKNCLLVEDEVLLPESVLEKTCTVGFAFWAPWGRLCKKSVYYGINYPRLKVGEDAWVYPQLIKNCSKISMISSFVYYYYQIPGSLTKSNSTQRMFDGFLGDLHVTREMLNLSLVLPARRWFNRTVHYALQTSQPIEALGIIKDTISPYELRLLLRGCGFKLYLKWLCLYVPGVYRAIRWVKTRLGYE